jgi:2-polyprenyl-3-methyl-5-hydroxy-6-metoxy-1,4-benzoquinol methylase
MTPLLTHFLLQQRLAAVTPYLRGDVLDLGCGGGQLISYLGPGQTYTGVDWRADTIHRLRVRYPQHEFYQRDLDCEPLVLPRRFDTIVLLAVLEHLQSPTTLLAQLREALKPGGCVVMTSPSGWGNWIHKLGARVGLFSQAAADEHYHIYSRTSLAALLQPHGVSLTVFRPFLLGANQLFVCTALLAGAA